MQANAIIIALRPIDGGPPFISTRMKRESAWSRVKRFFRTMLSSFGRASPGISIVVWTQSYEVRTREGGQYLGMTLRMEEN